MIALCLKAGGLVGSRSGPSFNLWACTAICEPLRSKDFLVADAQGLSAGKSSVEVSHGCQGGAERTASAFLYRSWPRFPLDSSRFGSTARSARSVREKTSLTSEYPHPRD